MEMCKMCKNYIIIVVHQIQGHRIYSESIGWAIDAQGSPESPGSGSNRDLVSILYRLQYTHPNCTAQARPPEVYQPAQPGRERHRHSLLYHAKPSAIRTIWPDRKETTRRPQNLHEPRPE